MKIDSPPLLVHIVTFSPTLFVHMVTFSSPIISPYSNILFTTVIPYSNIFYTIVSSYSNIFYTIVSSYSNISPPLLFHTEIFSPPLLVHKVTFLPPMLVKNWFCFDQEKTYSCLPSRIQFTDNSMIWRLIENCFDWWINVPFCLLVGNKHKTSLSLVANYGGHLSTKSITSKTKHWKKADCR